MRYIILHALLIFLFLAPPLRGQSSYSEFERDLHLSQPQRTYTEEAGRRYMDGLQGLNQESINKRLELQELYKNPSVNRERIDRLQRDLNVLNDSKQNLYNRYRSDMSRVLTPEQRQRYNTFVDAERRRSMSRVSPYPPGSRPSPYSHGDMSVPGSPASPRRPAVPYSYGPSVPSGPGTGYFTGPPRSGRTAYPPAYRSSMPPGRPPGPHSRSPGRGRHGR